ncbi:MAG: glycoside hydrolase family 92 protein [Bacteroidetes bacterium]|nr:glycoside hydrolase family 92 protein [Bacteroidota bacterium]
MKNYLVVIVSMLALFLSSCSNKNQELTDYVDPFIGTGGHGHTYPGATLPFGMVQLSPDTRLTGWDGCSGYHYSDSIIYGFTHTHLSGTGCSDYGDILLMPYTGELLFENGSDGNKGYSSAFQKKNEKAEVGYYQVLLDDDHIDVELTCSKRVGFHKYTFNEVDTGRIILDLIHRDVLIDSEIKALSATKIEGVRKSSAWARNQQLFFAIEFSQAFFNNDIEVRVDTTKGHEFNFGNGSKAVYQFVLEKDKTIMVKVGISAVSKEGAWKNLEEEIPHWDFEQVKNEANESWNKELSKIVVEGGTKEQKTIFYTALYHAMLAPDLFMDVDGQYLGRDLQIHQADGFDYYTTFSLWDTYRAEHPLLTIIDQKRTNDFINTFVKQYEQGGSLPVWEFAANETMCMIGYHSIPVIVDAYMKGIRNYNIEKVYEAMKHSANLDHLGLEAYKKYGYIPADQEPESVSKTLEYAYDDWCIAQMAKELGKEEDFNYFIKRAQSYKNIFDKSTGFMRAKWNGSWFSPFDPKEVNIHYTEANCWQYSFYVPQDVSGLINLMGGKEKFIEKLDQLFTESSETTGRQQSDITGLIGQYAHGNEPSHHMAYLYAYANAPSKTQEMAARIMKEMYTDQPDGYAGNEDCGQMSAWYVMSAMGFYQVTPGSNQYVIGSPVFEKVTINLENGKQFIIEANKVSDENIYIQAATLNDQDYSKCFISHEDIMNGGRLSLEMGDLPNKNWGIENEDIPLSQIESEGFLEAPTLKNKSKTFYDEMTLEFEEFSDEAVIFYSLFSNSIDALILGSLKKDNFSIGVDNQVKIYNEPIVISETTYLIAWIQKGELKSPSAIAHFIKSPIGRNIEIKSEYAPQYSADGDKSLIDGIRGDYNWRLGAWHGYEGKDFEAIVNFENGQVIDQISIGFLQDNPSWIFMPTEVEFYVSEFDHKFAKVGVVKSDVKLEDEKVQIKNFTLNIDKAKAVSIKIVAKSIKQCPSWHLGAGEKSWLFVDEVVID